MDAIAERLTAKGGPFAVGESLTATGTQQVFIDGPQTLIDLYRKAESFGAAPAATGTLSLTYHDLLARAAALAAHLARKFGVRTGSRVALALPNSPEWMACFIAITGLGACAVLMNDRGTATEIGETLRTASCDLLITGLAQARALRESGTPWPTLVAADGDTAPFPSLAEGMEGWQHAAPSYAPVDPDSGAFVIFTSGTTDRPKGAVLTHRSATHGICLTEIVSALNVLRVTGADVSTVPLRSPAVLLAAPLFHISGGQHGFLRSLAKGQTLVPLPKWDPATAARLVRQHKMTLLGMVPTMAWDMLAVLEGDPGALDTLRYLAFGGTALPAELVEPLHRALPNCVLGSTYGSTEVSGAVTGLGGRELDGRPWSCGRVLPTVDLRLEAADGSAAPTGEPGEICVRGAMVMQGYLDRPDLTAQAMRGGWLHTGDVGTLDSEGFLRIVGRLKNMIISGGLNIYCDEIERVISAHEAVLEVIAHGRPDQRLGERLAVTVVTKPGHRIDEEAVRTQAAGQLAKYKIPRDISVRAAPLPRLPNGKIDRKNFIAADLAAGAASGAKP
jgi:long-chain acyl-CoA synthetase